MIVAGVTGPPIFTQCSNVEVGDAERILLDELAAGFDDFAHQAGEDFVGDVGLGEDQFTRAVLAAPGTRPDRYTILEHLALGEEQTRAAVADFVSHLA